MKMLSQDKIDEVISLYQEGKSTKEIGQILQISASCCTDHLYRNHIPVRGPKLFKRTCSIDLNYFNDINTEDKAYWLGFLFADGCLYQNKMTITISEKDELHLEKFKTNAKLGHKIIKHDYKYSYSKQNQKPTVTLNIRSNEWTESFNKLGLYPNKSLIANPNLELIPNNLHRHFWRGMIDGDGCIHLSKSSGDHIITLCGSLSTCQKFSKFFTDLGLPKRSISQKGKIYNIQYQGLYLPQIVASVLYTEANIYLERKYKLYKDLMSIQGRLKTKYYYLAEGLGIFNGSFSII